MNLTTAMHIVVRAGLGLAIGTALCASAAGSELVKAPKSEAKPSPYQYRSLYGSYLAGRFARSQREMSDAAKFYRKALGRDPGNKDILQQAFLSEAAVGNWPEVRELAAKVIETDPDNRLARIFSGVAAFKSGDSKLAETHFLRAGVGPIGELTSTLARAWTRVAQDEKAEALRLVDGLKQDWAKFYREHHKAMILDALGDQPAAGVIWEKLFKQETRTVRVAIGYARHAIKTGQKKLAERILRRHIKDTPGRDALAISLLQDIEKDAPADLMVTNATEGLAELVYGLGEALTTEGGIDVGTIYLQLALFLKPDFDVAHYALGTVHEATKHYERAIGAYGHIPQTSPIAFEAALRRAFNQNWLERVDDAKEELTKLLEIIQSELASLENSDAASVSPAEEISQSNRARYAQEALRRLGYYEQAVDGVVGPKTTAAVKAFQKAAGWAMTALLVPRPLARSKRR